MINIHLIDKSIFILDNDQPTTCPVCGERTEFYDVKVEGEIYQYHICLDDDCFFSFLGEFE